MARLRGQEPAGVDGAAWRRRQGAARRLMNLPDAPGDPGRNEAPCGRLALSGRPPARGRPGPAGRRRGMSAPRHQRVRVRQPAREPKSRAAARCRRSVSREMPLRSSCGGPLRGRRQRGHVGIRGHQRPRTGGHPSANDQDPAPAPAPRRGYVHRRGDQPPACGGFDSSMERPAGATVADWTRTPKRIARRGHSGSSGAQDCSRTPSTPNRVSMPLAESTSRPPPGSTSARRRYRRPLSKTCPPVRVGTPGKLGRAPLVAAVQAPEAAEPLSIDNHVGRLAGGAHAALGHPCAVLGLRDVRAASLSNRAVRDLRQRSLTEEWLRPRLPSAPNTRSHLITSHAVSLAAARSPTIRPTVGRSWVPDHTGAAPHAKPARQADIRPQTSDAALLGRRRSVRPVRRWQLLDVDRAHPARSPTLGSDEQRRDRRPRKRLHHRRLARVQAAPVDAHPVAHGEVAAPGPRGHVNRDHGRPHHRRVPVHRALTRCGSGGRVGLLALAHLSFAPGPWAVPLAASVHAPGEAAWGQSRAPCPAAGAPGPGNAQLSRTGQTPRPHPAACSGSTRPGSGASARSPRPAAREPATNTSTLAPSLQPTSMAPTPDIAGLAELPAHAARIHRVGRVSRPTTVFVPCPGPRGRGPVPAACPANRMHSTVPGSGGSCAGSRSAPPDIGRCPSRPGRSLRGGR